MFHANKEKNSKCNENIPYDFRFIMIKSLLSKSHENIFQIIEKMTIIKTYEQLNQINYPYFCKNILIITKFMSFGICLNQEF